MRYLYLLWLRTCFYLYLYSYLLLQQWDDKHNYRRKCDDDDDDGVGSSRRNRRDDDKKVWNNDTATITTATKRIIIVNVFLSVLFLCFCFDMKKSERETVAFFSQLKGFITEKPTMTTTNVLCILTLFIHPSKRSTSSSLRQAVTDVAGTNERVTQVNARRNSKVIVRNKSTWTSPGVTRCSECGLVIHQLKEPRLASLHKFRILFQMKRSQPHTHAHTLP